MAGPLDVPRNSALIFFATKKKEVVLWVIYSDYHFWGTVFTQKEGNIHFCGLFDSEVVVLVLVGLHSNVIQFGGHSPCQKYGDFWVFSKCVPRSSV